MKKRLFSLLTALLLICAACPALARSSQKASIPLGDAYPVNAGDNAWFEVPMALDAYETPSSFPVIGIADYVADDLLSANAVFAYMPEGLTIQEGDMDVRGFMEEGRLVLSGTEDTGVSRVIERYTINDLPAVRVEMLGQGFEMIWVGDCGDMYFFMYPTADEDFAQAIREVAATLHLVESRTAPVCNPDDYIWTDDENGVTIAGYTGTATRIAIPAEIGGKPVVALNDAAFYEADVTWVSVPDSVTRIGRYCFSGCTLLQTLHLPAGLKEISEGMLESCMRLYALEIPEGVTSIGKYAFWCNFYLTELHLPASLTDIAGFNFVSCDCLERFTLAEGNTAYKLLDNGKVLLTADGKRLVHYCAYQSRGMYIVPAGVEVISAFAFGRQESLRTVILTDSVTTIEGAAFLSVTGLQSIMIPGSVTSLGKARVILQDGILLPDPEGEERDITISICVDAVIVAPEGSAAQTHAERFNLIFEAAQSR
ncbi:MAG: leucine-rich repeat protein [Clostridia bacterium]|nr:leucine-rich repeat protein [Clostridia bacterium]